MFQKDPILFMGKGEMYVLKKNNVNKNLNRNPQGF